LNRFVKPIRQTDSSNRFVKPIRQTDLMNIATLVIATQEPTAHLLREGRIGVWRLPVAVWRLAVGARRVPGAVGT
jgi:hypothetical protein